MPSVYRTPLLVAIAGGASYDMRQTLLLSFEIVEIFLVTLVALFTTYHFVAQPFLVQGASMEPNFQSGNYLLVDELSYRFEDPARGDIVVFRYPGEKTRKVYYIKRIIGLPRETVVIAKDGMILVNDEPLPEAYLPSSTSTSTFARSEFVLGEDQYFVLGDNRAASFDSRSWGPITRADVIGKVRFRFWPPTGISASL